MKYKSYQIAGKLDRNSWNRFVREVRRGSRTQHVDTQAFVAGLADHFPDFEVEDEALFSKIFPDQAYSANRIRVIRAGFYTLLEEYLIEMELDDQPNIRERLVALALRRKGLYKLSKKVVEKSQSRSDAAGMYMDGLAHDLALEEERMYLHQYSRQRVETYDWDQILGRLENYSISFRLLILCAKINNSEFIFDHSEPDSHFSRALAEAESRKEQLPPLAAIYYRILSLFTGRDISTVFPELETLFRQYDLLIARNEKMNIFGFLTNFLYNRDRHGDPKSLPALLRSFKVMHQQDLIFGAGAYSVIMTRNVTGVGARMGDIKWTTAFLNEAREKLPAPENENAFHYGSAYLAFAQQRYPEARQHLSRVEYSDAFYRLANDNLLLRISYESRDESLFYATHATLTRHLYRKEGISPQVRKAMQNLLKAMMALFELRWGHFDPDKFQETKAMIRAFEDVYNRDWLRAKVGELEE